MTDDTKDYENQESENKLYNQKLRYYNDSHWLPMKACLVNLVPKGLSRSLILETRLIRSARGKEKADSTFIKEGGGISLRWYISYIISEKKINNVLSSVNKGKSCQEMKIAFPHASDGMYQVQPDGGVGKFWAYCDMTSFGGGWTMCYSTNNLVNPKTEVTYDESLPYGTNGYRTDCNHIQVPNKV